jgi:hypothetical protein
LASLGSRASTIFLGKSSESRLSSVHNFRLLNRFASFCKIPLKGPTQEDYQRCATLLDLLVFLEILAAPSVSNSFVSRFPWH